MTAAPKPASPDINRGDYYPDLCDSIDLLQDYGLDRLRDVWQASYGPPPALRSVELFRLMLAFRLQAEGANGLDNETRRMLRRRGPVQAEGLELGVGARLTRDWQGRTVEVVVEADGFRFENQVYPSLSAAATAIAGSRWNGPRFFGLRGTSS